MYQIMNTYQKDMEEMDRRYGAPQPPPDVVLHFQQCYNIVQERLNPTTKVPSVPTPLEASHQSCAPNNVVGSLNA